jgi:putative transcriptional regulator
MSKNKTYKSDALAAIHETVCLTPIEDFTGNDIRALREREQVSQDVFARYLNVSKGMVSKWECDKKQPTGSSKKLLSLVKKKGLSAIA